MIVATVDFPDERTPGSKHLHAGFSQAYLANMWIRNLKEAYNTKGEIQKVEGQHWLCPDCRELVRHPA